MINPSHYVSLKVAQQLQKAGILFPESEKAHLRVKQFGCAFSDWDLFSRACAATIEVCSGKELVEHLQNNCLETVETISAPSLIEILDGLPSHYSIVRAGKNKWFCTELIGDYVIEAPTAPGAAAKMLIKTTKDRV